MIAFRSLALALALLALAPIAPLAEASFWDAAAASRFFDAQGRRAYARSDLDSALDYFLLAHDAAPAASSAFNVATVAELAGDPALAFAFLVTYEAMAAADDANHEAARTAATRLAARLAVVDVVTVPAGAEVFVDLREHGRYVTGPGVVAMEPGRHVVIASLGGHADATVVVEARLGERTRVELRLEELRSELRVVGAPEGATVTYDRGGEVIGRFPAAEPAQVPAGDLHVVVRCEGYEPFERMVRVATEAAREVLVSMTPTPPRLGRLLVSTGDLVARVAVDGVERTETPATLRLPAGEHVLTLSAAGFAPVTEAVIIEADAAVLVERRLSRDRSSR